MRVLIIHHEARCFAGAEKLLVDFLDALVRSDCEVAIALVRGSELDQRISPGIARIFLADSSRFSVAALVGQVRTLRSSHRAAHFDLVHGWSARDWELATLLPHLLAIPSVGTLHDHPQASFITAKRQRVMRVCARWGFDRVICVSEAVKAACLQSGYPSHKLVTVLNGVPCPETRHRSNPPEIFRLGFLGAFCERKGLRGLFEMVSQLRPLTTRPWKLILAGAAQDDESRALVEEIRGRYASRDWWAQVEWRGWISSPMQFLEGIDLLICPSSQFEPFGLVLCEAGLARIPVLATRVGGIPEIVRPDETGWLIEAGDWSRGARLLAEAMAQPEVCRELGERGCQRIREHFSIEKMAGQYLRLYSTVRRDE